MADSKATTATRPGPIASTDWNALLAPYRSPVLWRSIYQVVNTVIPLVLLWAVMLWSLRIGYWLTLLLAVPTALLFVRLFMIQHDCGHFSFFRSRRANNAVGSVIGVLLLVPYVYWRKTHAIHHATSGNLDHRTYGDIDTLTVREYVSRPRWKRMLYRLYRNPLVLLLIGPAWQFIIKHRFPADIPRAWKREWASVHWTNLGLATIIAAMSLTIGIERFLLVQLPITLLSGSIGVYLFYVQHQYEDTYWRYQEAWDYYAAGLEGASHLVMPRILQWFTANIGLHHIHHVASRIPNYRLQTCYDENPELHRATRLTLPQSARTLFLTLWDEEKRKLIRFRDLPEARARLRGQLAPGTEIEPTRPDSIPRSWR